MASLCLCSPFTLHWHLASTPSPDWNKGPHVGTTHRAKPRERLSAIFLQISLLLLTLLSLSSPWNSLAPWVLGHCCLVDLLLSWYSFLDSFPPAYLLKCSCSKVFLSHELLQFWLPCICSTYIPPALTPFLQPIRHPPNNPNTLQAPSGSHQLLSLKSAPYSSKSPFQAASKDWNRLIHSPSSFLPLSSSPPHAFHKFVPCLFTPFSFLLKDSAHTLSSPRWLPRTRIMCPGPNCTSSPLTRLHWRTWL